MIESCTRVALFLFGIACVAVEVWTSYAFMIEKEGHVTPGMASVIVLTSLASMAPIGSEFCYRMGRKAMSWAFMLALPLALAVVFMAAIQRNGSTIDGDENARLQVVEDVRIAKAEEAEAVAQLPIDRREVDKNCTPWGPKCQKAKDAQSATEAKLAGARASLKRHGVVAVDPLIGRLAIYLHLPEKQVQLYLPLLVPMGLAVFGYLSLTAAFLHRKAAPAPIPAPPVPVEAKVLPPAVEMLPAPAQRPRLVANNVKEPPAAMTRIITPLLAKAPIRQRLAAEDLYGAYATQASSEGLEAVPLARFLLCLKVYCDRLGIQTTVIDSKAYLRGVRLVA